VKGRHITIVLEQAIEQGGMERVVELVLRSHPGARVLSPDFAESNVPDAERPQWLARVEPFAVRGERRRPLWAPRYARRIARAPIDATDLVLSFSGHGWSLAATPPAGAPHVTYATGLPRSLYDEFGRYVSAEPFVMRPLLRAALPLLRADSARRARRPDRVLTVSQASADAFAAGYGIAAEVLHPPVRTDFFTPAPRARRHVLVVGRLVNHKRIDVAIEAARLAGLPVVVAGAGRRLEALRARAGNHATFTGWVDDDRLRELYRESVACVCPSVEEFGIVMAEAQACGIPVVAPRAGGALDIVQDGVTGRLAEDRSAAGLAEALRDLPDDPAACRAAGARFSEERFIHALDDVLAQELGQLARRAPRSPLHAPAAALR
jgi:glycosyltransferase involved in cell wall biosynthesis